MNFGQALEALKQGRHVARDGWNGKGMYIFLQGNVMRTDGIDLLPCIVMLTATGEHQPGWLASQADMLGEDWEVL